MPLSYNGLQLTPAPFVSFSKSYQTSNDGKRVGSVWNIILDGKIVPHKGSPNASGTFYGSGVTPPDDNLSTNDYMTAILRKQEGIRLLFSQEGKQLYIKGLNTPVGGENIAVYCNPRIKTPVDFPKGNNTSWATIGDYRVVLEADVLYTPSGTYEDTGNFGGYYIENANEQWDMSPQDFDLGTYRLTHTISAKGKRFYSSTGSLDKEAWERAKDYVTAQLGVDTRFMYATGVLNNSNLQAYNYVRAQKVGENDGTFEVTESFLCYAAGTGIPATNTFDVDSRLDMNGTAKVSLKGKIEGLDYINPVTNIRASGKYYNALQKLFDLQNSFLSMASGYSNVTLNPTPLVRTIGLNPIAGVITYNYEYDNRPLNVVSGALSETVSVGFEYPIDVAAELAVLGRGPGPVLQSIQTIGTKVKTINFEAVLLAKTMTYTATKPDTNSFISGLAPSDTWVFKQRDTENWIQEQGRYSRSVSWKYGS